MENETQTTLRDTIEANVDAAEKSELSTSSENIAETTSPKDSIIEVTSDKKEDKARDGTGKFVKQSASNEKSIEANPEIKVTDTKPRPQRPSSWKKDYWDDWEKLDPKVAEYVLQREKEYSNGVSTYKNEWDRAKPLLDAIAPFDPILKQNNIDPADWIKNLGNAHHMLVSGSPQEKLSMFMKLVQDYQIPVGSMFTQGQDGKLYYNPQVQAWQPQQQPQDVKKVVKDAIEEFTALKQVEQFVSSGNYPHLDQVRETMVGLLQARFAPDLKTAYETALRMPQHQDIWDSVQQQKLEQDEQKKREEAAKLVSSAKAKTISPKSSTPAGNMKDGNSKGLRSSYENAFDEHSGRV